MCIWPASHSAFLRAHAVVFIASKKKVAGPFEHATVLQNKILNTGWRGGSYLDVSGAAGFGVGDSGCCSGGLLYIYIYISATQSFFL